MDTWSKEDILAAKEESVLPRLAQSGHDEASCQITKGH